MLIASANNQTPDKSCNFVKEVQEAEHCLKDTDN